VPRHGLVSSALHRLQHGVLRLQVRARPGAGLAVQDGGTGLPTLLTLTCRLLPSQVGARLLPAAPAPAPVDGGLRDAAEAAHKMLRR
jgi:hypothetical protein